MFERYTEKARLAIFIAREQASEFGRETIEADFILLGIARESPELCHQWLGAYYADLREKIEPMYATKKKVPTYTDLPLSSSSKRVLAYADEEAGRLGDRHVDCEHLFLGLLHEDDTASKMLKARGEDLQSVRVAIAQESSNSEAKPPDAFFTSVKTRIVNENGSDLAIVPWHGRVPALGEAINVPESKGGETIYRICDVNWRIKPSALTAFRVAEIVLTVRREKLQP